MLFVVNIPFLCMDSFSVDAASKKKVVFNANKGRVSKTVKYVKKGRTYGTLPTPKRSGYGFLGWFTRKSGGTKITSSTKVTTTKKRTLYAHWGKKLTVYFNANNGSVSTKKKTITRYKKYYTLPTPTREGYIFMGWYTKKSGGKVVTRSTIVKAKKSYTLYARWKEKIKVACVGASIVYGTGLSSRNTYSYPAQLQAKLGKYYNVNNYGASGTTVGLYTGKSYLDTSNFMTSYTMGADEIFILLGTNDTNKAFWRDFLSDTQTGDEEELIPFETMAKEYIRDYKVLLRLYERSAANSDINIMTLPDILDEERNGNKYYMELIPYLNEELENLAVNNGYGFIDANAAFKNQPSYYSYDGIHITSTGAKKLADLAKGKV